MELNDMDAQNAVEAASTKPVSPPQRSGGPDQPKPTVTKPTIAPRSSPPPKEARSSATTSQTQDGDDGVDDGGQSEAETIVLKDGLSPAKPHKAIKHEDKSDGDADADGDTDPSGGRKRPGPIALHRDPPPEKGDRDRDRDRAGGVRGYARDGGPVEGATALPGKKRRLHDSARPGDKPRSKDGSSGLSSAPASPPAHHRRRRSSNPRSASDSDSVRVTSPETAARDKPRSLDKLVPHKRKASKAESDEEGESRKARRQRISIEGLPPGKPHRDSKISSSSRPHDPTQGSRTRSVSPQPRAHRRSISTTQLPSHSNGLSHKKRRIPAPLQSTDYHSDESSASGSPRIRSSKLRTLTTPATTESNVSPAKMAPHKKHLDAHGQTFLARACARGEYEHAKVRLVERPEDLNVADFAGNTPLQIASLNGYENIVKLLLDAGCNLECVNHDKETPLLDAVDNGHLGVVRLLLDAGVNPRKANVNGEEPLDRVNEELDNASEIRAALQDAKKSIGERRLTSEDHHDHDESRDSNAPDSPRRSPAASSHAAGAARRAGTVRATKTSDRLLYMPMDDKTLRLAAGRGDEATVTRILQVRDTFDDPESMVAAARGGHDVVMQLLLALGSANPDPAPVPSMQRELGTPMLAAIGQENIKVIRLLLDQNSFDPTRRFQGETYHEIARRRQGTNWKEEEQMLKGAYDAYKKTHKDTTAKTKSPARRDQDRESRRAARPDAKDDPARPHKRKPPSPNREGKKSAPGKMTTSPREKRRSNSFSGQADEQTSPKRGPGRPRKEDRVPAIAISDREASPAALKHPAKPKKTESDLAAVSSEGETIKPRRKLVSGRELKGAEREKQRRGSIVSTASSMKEPSSPRDARHDDPSDKHKSDKHLDRTKQLRRDESKDRLAVSGDGFGKRPRSSATPPLHASSERDGEAPPKRRRLDADAKDRKQKQVSSDDRPAKTSSSRDPAAKAAQRERDDDDRRDGPRGKKRATSEDRSRRESGKSIASERSIHVKSEDMDVDMPDADQLKHEAEAAARVQREKEEEQRKKEAEAQAQALLLARRKEEEQKRREEEEKRKRDEEEAQRKEQEEKKRREEEEKRRREEEERKRKEDEERKRQEDEERKRREEEERKRRAEEEKQRLEDERRRKEEEQRKQREEEERLRREQLEREAAEAARRKRDEEERKERERLQREELERRRAAREAEQRRLRDEQDRLRLSKLPGLIRWLEKCPNPKTSPIAQKFAIMQGVRADCLRPEIAGTAEGREQWVLNTQVALLLGEKDLSLSRYTAWERIPASKIAKTMIWRIEHARYALTDHKVFDLGLQEDRNYYDGNDPHTARQIVMERINKETGLKFFALDMFFVKVRPSLFGGFAVGGRRAAKLISYSQVSELMYIVPTFPHLRNVKLVVNYQELPEHESQLLTWGETGAACKRWKNDPGAEARHGFAPRAKYYINGELVSEHMPQIGLSSKTPFDHDRVPRRGLMAVKPDDPEYARLCREQGLEHLLTGTPSPGLPNGVHGSSPLSGRMAPPGTNGVVKPQQAHPLVNGAGSGPGASVNGINGTSPDTN